ncbi:MAG: RNA 2'-phosphotransferase, partial [Planctomycetaceae bacterium]|nr:RNA 2'-phosphotransferase [Planctomycetaceae bacterium]
MRLSSDKLLVTSYSQDSEDPDFYTSGVATAELMLEKIYQKHGWSRLHDPAWDYLHENAARAGVSGRTAAYSQPDPELFDEGVYRFGELTTHRKGKWSRGTFYVDGAYNLRILDLTVNESWRSTLHGQVNYMPPQHHWDPVSRVFTSMLRWDGCMKGRRYEMPCDTGGWFPLQLLCGQNFGGVFVDLALVLNIVANDDKGRFQVCAEVNREGTIYDYFAIRACSGHGIPWLDPRRMSCHLDRQDLDMMGCITHVTTKASLIGIFRGGLIPGGAASRSVRAETNFECYFPNDERRLVKGRVGQKGFDITIIFDKDRLIRNCDLYLSPNGVLLTKDVVSPLSFHSVVEHSQGIYRLLYHQMLMNEKIEGFYWGVRAGPRLQWTNVRGSRGERRATKHRAAGLTS